MGVFMSQNGKVENNELEKVTKQKEDADRLLLNAEMVLAVLAVLLLLGAVLVASFVEMALWLKIGLIVFGAVVCFAAFVFALKIEQIAGFYECAKCHHKFVPTFKEMNLSMHMGRTRYFKCPHCKEKSWCKKVISEK